MVAVPPAASVRPVHWMVLPATATAPEAELTQPAPAVVRGAVQPAGTTVLRAPPEMPPVAAVLGEGNVWPLAPVPTFGTLLGSGPAPSAGETVIQGVGPVAPGGPGG